MQKLESKSIEDLLDEGEVKHRGKPQKLAPPKNYVPPNTNKPKVKKPTTLDASFLLNAKIETIDEETKN